jgi:RNA polymerase sigma-70 factor, ECF subfamily
MTREPGGDVEAAVASAFAREWGQVVATLIRITGDWDLAEDSAADAFTTALERWRRDGVPRNPGAWLTTTARNRATDRIRREVAGNAKMRQAAMLAPDGDEPAEPDEVRDDRLRLIFTCCHPALPFESRVALTLRTLTGLTTAEIARAFLVSDDHVPAADPRQEEDPRGRDPVPGAARAPAARATVGGARCRLPPVQRGVRGDCRW